MLLLKVLSAPSDVVLLILQYYGCEDFRTAIKISCINRSWKNMIDNSDIWFRFDLSYGRPRKFSGGRIPRGNNNFGITNIQSNGLSIPLLGIGDIECACGRCRQCRQVTESPIGSYRGGISPCIVRNEFMLEFVARHRSWAWYATNVPRLTQHVASMQGRMKYMVKSMFFFQLLCFSGITICFFGAAEGNHFSPLTVDAGFALTYCFLITVILYLVVLTYLDIVSSIISQLENWTVRKATVFPLSCCLYLLGVIGSLSIHQAAQCTSASHGVPLSSASPSPWSMASIPLWIGTTLGILLILCPHHRKRPGDRFLRLSLMYGLVLYPTCITATLVGVYYDDRSTRKGQLGLALLPMALHFVAVEAVLVLRLGHSLYLLYKFPRDLCCCCSLAWFFPEHYDFQVVAVQRRLFFNLSGLAFTTLGAGASAWLVSQAFTEPREGKSLLSYPLLTTLVVGGLYFAYLLVPREMRYQSTPY